MNKVAFIIPYFGKLPDYFSEWIYSVSFLTEKVDFILITDDSKNTMLKSCPSNVIVMPMSFDEFRRYVQRKFDFKVSIPNAYKICDFRPAYGYIFEEILKPYSFWGNCDLDQVWGKFSNFITPGILKKFDKILYLGHFSLHKNSEKMRTMFMNEGGMANYKEVFSSPNFYAFDEFAGMVSICKKNGVRTYYKQIYADIAVMQKRITLRKLPNYKRQIVYWKNGMILRSYIDNNQVKTEEYIYSHFQKKHPKSIMAHIHKPDAFIIQGNRFIDISGKSITISLINQFSDYHGDVEDRKDQVLYYFTKSVSFFKSSIADKKIWIRRKIFAKNL